MSLIDWFIIPSVISRKTDEVKEEIGQIEKQKLNREQQQIDALVTTDIPPQCLELMHWHAPSRIYLRSFNKYKAVFFALLLIIIVFAVGIIHEWIPALVLFAALALIILVLFIRPPETEIAITDKGIVNARFFFPWTVLSNFSTKKVIDFNILVVETKTSMSRLELVCDETKLIQIKGALSKFLPFRSFSSYTLTDMLSELVVKILS